MCGPPMKSTNLAQSPATPYIRPLAALFVVPIIRRTIFFGVVLLTLGIGIRMMFDILRANDLTGIELLILLLFAVTFGWITLAFWTAMSGFILRLSKRDPLSLRRCPPGESH